MEPADKPLPALFVYYETISKKMKKLTLFLVLSVIAVSLQAQQHKEPVVVTEVSGMQVVKSIFPEAAEIVQANEVWFKIVNAKKELLGYCLSSKPFSDGIKGYNGTTPVIVVMDNSKVIKKITLLTHSETRSYIAKLERQKFFGCWQGLTIRDALNVKATPDTYSGATLTAGAVRRNVDLVLRKANEKRL